METVEEALSMYRECTEERYVQEYRHVCRECPIGEGTRYDKFTVCDLVKLLVIRIEEEE